MGFFDFLKGETGTKHLITGGIRLQNVAVDIMFIIKNGNVVYVNNDAEHLFTLDSGNDLKLEGRIVRMQFTSQSGKDKVEVFIAFEEQEIYSLFTLGDNRDDRLNKVAYSVLEYFAKNKTQNIFILTETYSSQYEYTFKLYKRDNRYFMVNNSQSQAYIIDSKSITRSDNIRDGVNTIKDMFWK